MKSVNRVISVRKSSNLGMMPVFICIGHRHLEKEMPVGVKGYMGVDYQIPVDLLKVSVDDPDLLKDITDVTLTYHTK